MSETGLLYLLLIIITVDFLLSQWLKWLNDRNRKLKPGKEAEGIYDAQRYQESMRYGTENSRFTTISASFGFLVTSCFLLMGGFGWLHHTLAPLAENPLFVSMIFFAVLFFASDIMNIPFEWYDTFVIEERYGFNKQTPILFLTDKLKSYAITIIIGGGVLYCLLWLILEIGESFWWWFWLIAAVLMLLINMFYSSLILPLFNRLSPLEDGELKEAIQQYCRKVNFPLDNLYVIDGSRRSTKANAFFSGMGKKKKIVLYDTLIEKHTIDELVAILAHEVGHYKKKHIIWSYLIAILQMGVMLYLLSVIIFEPKLSMALGATSWAPHINLVAFGILYSPISMLTGIGMNVLSRKNEFEADEFAAKTYSAEPLIVALKKLSADNLSNLYPHKSYVFVHYSHPPLLERLAALNKTIV